MTWGSNATFVEMNCPWCGGRMVDDANNGLSTHQRTCGTRFQRMWVHLFDTIDPVTLWRGRIRRFRAAWRGER